MRCNQCKHEETKVIESREAMDGEAIRRRRECINCAHRFTTYERIEKPQLVVIKSSGQRTPKPLRRFGAISRGPSWYARSYHW